MAFAGSEGMGPRFRGDDVENWAGAFEPEFIPV